MLIITDLDTKREYLVTVHKNVDWLLVHDELIINSSSDDSIDSDIIPDRACECCKERPTNKRNTHYNLTEREASKLRQDPRIIAVVAAETIPDPIPYAIHDGIFDRSTSSGGQHDNWGLLRHTQTINSGYNSGADPGETYDYVLDGTGVDVVIMDSGIEADHPEWEDAFGVSRLKQINWYAASGIGAAGSQLPTDFYKPTNNYHGTHVTGIVAGKTFGWAKNADIYSFKMLHGPGELSVTDAFDMINGWHLKKNDPTDSAYTGRPTVLNMSWGHGIYVSVDQSGAGDAYISSNKVVGGQYRGTTHSESNYNNLRLKGMTTTADNSNGWNGRIGAKVASTDADVATLIDNGIHIAIASGNYYQKVDIPGGTDYDNYVNVVNTSNFIYYNRGASPSLVEGAKFYSYPLHDNNPTTTSSDGFFVGALDTSSTANNEDVKAYFSSSGPAVNIYTAGVNIQSAWLHTGTLAGNIDYYLDSNYKQGKISGTSMASPQMAGAIACLLHAHPDWSPSNVKRYFESNSLSNMYDTGATDDYTTENTIHGGENRVLYFPLHGQKVFKYSGT